MFSLIDGGHILVKAQRFYFLLFLFSQLTSGYLAQAKQRCLSLINTREPPCNYLKNFSIFVFTGSNPVFIELFRILTSDFLGYQNNSCLVIRDDALMLTNVCQN